MGSKYFDEISSEEFDRTFKTNIYAMFYLCKAAVLHMQPSSSIYQYCLHQCSRAETEATGVFGNQGSD
ncbi:hypothetical protein [Nostoc sp.]|uniref:hypothetical protein n=1 Tax=Nostoc sp. TaxID=1180 RepID=UPI002FFA551A